MYAAGGFVLGEVCLLLPRWLGAGIPVILTAGVCYLWIKDEWRGTSRNIRYRREKRGGSSLLWWILPLFCVLGMLRLEADERSLARHQQVITHVRGMDVRLEGDVWRVTKKEKSTALELREVEVYAEGEVFTFSDVIIYVKKTQLENDSLAGSAEEGNQTEGKGDGIRELRTGMRIAVWGQLEAFDRATNPGQFDFSDYYHSQGFDGRMYGDYVQIVNYNYSPYYHFIARLKQQAEDVLAQICVEENLGIFQAVLLGDKGELDDVVQEMYQRSGIAHLLAVSGLHISLIGLGCYHLLRRLGLGFDGAGFMAALVTVSYGTLTGGTASVARAVTMILFQIAADKLGRTYDLLSAMAYAALTLLLESPTLLFQAGFQLSFGAILAIGMVNPVIVRWLHAECRWEKTIVLSLTIQIVTYPMMVYHFFEYPVYGLVLNLLVIPLMSYVVVSGLAGIMLGMLWIPGGVFAIGTGHYVLGLYEWLCRGFEKLPGAVWIMGRPKMWQIAGYVAGWSLILMWMHWGEKIQDDRRPDEKEQRNQGYQDPEQVRRGQMIGGIVPRIVKWGIFLTVVVGAFWTHRPHAPAGLEVTFLDVGQGDGTFFQTKEMSILVDGGSSDEKQLGEQVLEPFLKSKGISRIDYAIVSHGDQDHVSGLYHLFRSCQEIPIRCLVLPWRGYEDESCGKLQELAENVGTKVLWMKNGSRIQNQELLIQCLYAGENLTSEEKNEHSPLMEVTYGNVGIIMTGDMSAEGERQWLEQAKTQKLQGKLRILKAAHHGSRYSTSAEFLQKVLPEVTVISCGEGNSYGHPHEETLKRLDEIGSTVMVTKDCGAVIVKVGEVAEISCVAD